MAFDLNPVAVTAAPLLRALKAADWTSKKDLAERAGRHPNHIQRDLKVLAENGLVGVAEPFALTPEGEAQLAALDRAGDLNAAGAPTALHADLEPHPLNPRKDFETPEAEEALDELRISIVKSGLLQPIVVRPRPDNGKWWIVAGERRWRAIGQAISDGDWEEDLPVAITIREVNDRDHLLLALNENLQRSNMKAIEEGVAFAAAVHEFGLPTEELANRTGKSQRYVQQRIALLKLSQEDQDRMRLPKAHPSYLSFKDARSQTQTARQTAPEVIEEPATEAVGPLTVADFGVPAGWRADDVASASSWLTPFTMECFEYRDKKWTLTIQVARLVGGEGWVHGTSSEGPTQGSYSTLNGVWSGHMAAYQTREAAIAGAAAYITAGVLGKAPEKAITWLSNPAADEPGSPAVQPSRDATQSLGKSLSDVEVLILAEVTDAVERCSHPIHPSYAFCLSPENQAGVASLLARNLLAVRRIGDSVLIRSALLAGGVKDWLDGLGFYADREALLFELAVRVQGAENVVNRQQCGIRYATAWLNLTGDPRNEAAEAAPGRDYSRDAADALAYGMMAHEPEQPALIAPTPEEAAKMAEARINGERKEYARSVVRMLARETLALIDDPTFQIPEFGYVPKVHHSGHSRQWTINTLLAAVRDQNPRVATIFLGYTFASRTHAGRLDGFRKLAPDERDQLEGRILSQALAPEGDEGPAVGALRGLQKAGDAFIHDHIVSLGQEPKGDAYQALRAALHAARLITKPDPYGETRADLACQMGLRS